MITKIWYSIQNGGDGSAYPVWMESEALCKIDQEFMDEGWGEPCFGWLSIEHDTPIKVLDDIETVDTAIKEIEDQINKAYMQEYRKKGGISRVV
jgi:hypothetical protein